MPADATFPISKRAVVWVGARKLEIQQKPVRIPGDDELLVKIMATGICGSDCHNWESDKVSRQLILGHESSGVIERIGKSVQDRKVGDRVAVEPGFPCLQCEFCLRGSFNICAELKYCGLDPTDGTLCQYFVCLASMTVPIPENVSWQEAGGIQPLAVAVQLARRAGLKTGQTMAIFGCGPLGLLVLAVARAYGVQKIVMFNIEETRAKFAESYGADKGIVVSRNTNPDKDPLAFAQEYASRIILEQGIGHGCDVVVEASGAAVCVLMGICMLKAGGTLIQAGLGKPLVSVPLFTVTAKELSIKASEAFEAQHARSNIKIIILNQD
ncbi:xylitol dehydrogenase [Grosmannia clavigera kw1407]|uniref:D-xylulose reductase n=1 Tax=Grosmannia clavigera (strain kw1407 / UAMH 11150) TaxID=655863 RepID=F0XQT7_GROCL|nr:xylitol dehydrogenase [Grosmannia clavigera kw1407]EFX00029.1 xylitol dehydrogenase [Grosmannia clavigera kw1407]